MDVLATRAVSVLLLLLCNHFLGHDGHHRLLHSPEVLTSVEGALESVRVQNVKLFEQNDSCGVFLVFFDREFALPQVEDRNVSVDGVWTSPDTVVVNSLVNAVLLIRTGVHEQIHVSTVTVEVSTHHHASTCTVWLPTLLVEELNHGFGVVDGGMQVFARRLPPTV